MQNWSVREIEANPLAMGQLSSDDPGSSEADHRVIEVKRRIAELNRRLKEVHADNIRLKAYLQPTEYSSYEKVEKLLAEYVSNTWYTSDTSELKPHLLAISADVRFELLKKQYVLGTTALHKAAERGDTEVMRCLLEMVEPQKRYELLKIQHWRGETPLHAAPSRGSTEVMRCMLELVEPENQIQLLDIPNEYNHTALDVAEGEKTVQLIRQYIDSAERETAVERKLRALKAAIDCLEAKIYIQQLRAIASSHVDVVSAVAPDNQSSSLSVQQKSDKMGSREYLSYVRNDVSLEERESLMSDERLRSKFFLVNWPHDGNLSGVKMAQAGFYCIGTPGGRKSGDEPFEEHARWFPDCSFLLQLKGENYINEAYARTEDNEKTTSLIPDNLKWIFNPSLHGISSAVPSPPSYLTDVLLYVVGVQPDTPNPPSLDLLQQLAAMSPLEYRAAIRNDLSPFQLHWLMSMETQRRRTFLEDWPHAGNLSGEQMAQAGFYHSGGYDSVRCVFCGVVIHSWDVNDDPMAEHAKWFPLCWFVQGLAGGNMECPSGHPSDGVLSAPVQKGPAVVAAHAANSI